jgi:hypothetical protein
VGSFVRESDTAAFDSKARLRDYANKAYMYFMQAEKYQREGNWAKYGEEIRNLRDVLKSMKEIRE